MKIWYTLLPCLALASCSNQAKLLEVDKFTLRNTKISDQDVPMVRGDQRKYFFGAVTLEEQRQRLGQYYTLTWDLSSKPQFVKHPQPVVLTFYYRQGGTGAQIKRRVQRYTNGEKLGKLEVNIIGDDYLEGGRVLSWRATLQRGNQLLASEQSYLWK